MHLRPQLQQLSHGHGCSISDTFGVTRVANPKMHVGDGSMHRGQALSHDQHADNCAALWQRVNVWITANCGTFLASYNALRSPQFVGATSWNTLHTYYVLIGAGSGTQCSVGFC